jgi:hypothetical protein
MPVLYRKDVKEGCSDNEKLSSQSKQIVFSKFKWKSEAKRNSSGGERESSNQAKTQTQPRRASSFVSRAGKAIHKIASKGDFKVNKEIPAMDVDTEKTKATEGPADITWSPTMDESSSEDDETTQADSSAQADSIMDRSSKDASPPEAEETILLAPLPTVTSKAQDKTTKKCHTKTKTASLAALVAVAAAAVILGFYTFQAPSTHLKNVLCAPIRPGSTVTKDSVGITGTTYRSPWWVPIPSLSDLIFAGTCHGRSRTTFSLQKTSTDDDSMAVSIINEKIESGKTAEAKKKFSKVSMIKLDWNGQATHLVYHNGREERVDSAWAAA